MEFSRRRIGTDNAAPMTISRVTIVEVGPRDGLQNEQARVSTADKIEFVNRLSAAHLPVIEVCGLRQPEVGPADGRRRRGVRAASRVAPGTRYTALVPNLEGLDRALAARRQRGRDLRGGDRNVQPQEHQPEHRRVARHLPRGLPSVRIAAGLRVRGYLSTAFGCPFEGAVPPAAGRRRRGTAVRARRLRGRHQRHDRHRPSGSGAARARRGACARCRPIISRCTSTTRAAPRSPTSSPRCRSASPPSTRRPAALAAARTHRARPATWPPTICLHVERTGDRNRRVAGGAERGVSVYCFANRSPAAVALCAGGERDGIRSLNSTLLVTSPSHCEVFTTSSYG